MYVQTCEYWFKPYLKWGCFWKWFDELPLCREYREQTKTKSNQYLVWPPFAFKKTAPVLLYTHMPGFSRYLAGRWLENLPHFLFGFSLTPCLLSPHVIQDWLHDAEVRALLGARPSVAGLLVCELGCLWLWLYVLGCFLHAELIWFRRLTDGGAWWIRS